jgi:hypothetical protein
MTHGFEKHMGLSGFVDQISLAEMTNRSPTPSSNEEEAALTAQRVVR